MIRSRSARSSGTNRRQYPTWSMTPASAAAAAAASASAARTPTGFSQRMWIPAAAKRVTSARCWVDGAAIRTPSSRGSASISSSAEANVGAPRAATTSRTAGTGSTTPASSTSGASSRAARWTRPIRPAPISATRTGSEPMRAQVLAVEPLVACGTVRIGRVREDVLLDDEPAPVAAGAQALEHGLERHVAGPEPAERPAPPDLLHRRRVGHDLPDDAEARVLQVQVVDPPVPLAHRRQRIAAAEKEVAGVERDAHVGQLEHPLDLPRRLDIGRRVRVEGRLIPPLAAAIREPIERRREALPVALVPAEAAFLLGHAGMRGTRRGPGVRDRRPRRGDTVPRRLAGVEDVEQGVEAQQRVTLRVRIAEGHLEVAAGQRQPLLRQAAGQLGRGAEVAERPEVDAAVAGLGHRLQERDGIGNVRIDPDRHLKRAVAARRVGHRDAAGGRSHATTPSRSSSLGLSIRRPLRAHRAIAWQRATSRRPSWPSVRGGRSWSIASWNSISSRLNAST